MQIEKHERPAWKSFTAEEELKLTHDDRQAGTIVTIIITSCISLGLVLVILTVLVVVGFS